MSGRKLILTGTTLTDLSAPRIIVTDPIESAGSLLLVDLTHPSNPLAAGVPTTGATIPNILASTLTTGDATIQIGGEINNGTKGLVERSAQGGLHVIVSQANALASGDGVAIKISNALAAYLYTNRANAFYISFWDRLTRIQAGGANATIPYMFSASTLYSLRHFSSNGIWGGVSEGGGSRSPANMVGNRFGNTATVEPGSTLINTTVAQAATLPEWGSPSGSLNDVALASRNLFWESFVFYRFYLEDITVSGRSYADVDAIDLALYTTEVLTAGGRYYNDTFTAASSVP